MTVLGIDVSHYQGELDWHALSRSEFKFAYIKATEGSSNVDAMFSRNWASARDSGILHGAYHFGHPAYDPEQQAVHFASIADLDAAGFGELPPVLDLEVADGSSADALVAWTAAFVSKAEALFGRPITIYSGGFWRKHIGERRVPELQRSLLWLARYSKQEPVVPANWARWDFWQFTDGQSGEVMQVPGVRGRCDCNRYRGSLSELQALTMPDALPTPTPTDPSPDTGPNPWPGQYFVWPHVPAIRNQHVRSWQQRVKQLGFSLDVDGVYGPESRQACIALQRDVGLRADGIVGRETWNATFGS